MEIHGPVLLTLVILSTIMYCDGIQSQTFEHTNSDQDIITNEHLATSRVHSLGHCAVTCTSEPSCQTFSAKFVDSNEYDCHLSFMASPTLTSDIGANVYKIMSNVNAVDTMTIEDNTVTTQSLASCSNPDPIYSPFGCGTPTFSASGIIKLGSNRALVFTTTNEYLRCSSITNIVDGGAEACQGFYNIVGDSSLDPASDKFTTGPPDAGVAYIHSSLQDCQYYLFKDDKVHCYQHSNSHVTWMEPCQTGWSIMDIQDRFGAGIPSSPDDVIGTFTLSSYDFYFVKGNLVYKSAGNETIGSLEAEYPKLVRDVFPDMMCNITAATQGLNSGDYCSVVDNMVFKGQSGTVYDKGVLCHS